MSMLQCAENLNYGVKLFVKKFMLAIMICGVILSCETAGAEVKVLVAYFSHSGNTQKMANIIAEHLREDISVNEFRIIPAEDYPEDYTELRDIAQEEKNNDARPKIKYNTDLSGYDTIFLGYPIWWGTTPMIIRTFLETHDFGGKKIYPFNTHGGSGKGTSVDDIKKLLPRVSVGKGFAIRGDSVSSSTSKITEWVDSLRISGTEDSSSDSGTGCNVGIVPAFILLTAIIYKSKQ